MWKKINCRDLNENTFKLFNEQWALLSAGDISSHNTMTISWGGLGYMWNKNIATCVVRPQRHTLTYLQNNDYFTLSFFGLDGLNQILTKETYRNILSYLGRVSGKDENKIELSGLNVVELAHSITFKEAQMVMVMKKIYVDQFKEENFIDPTIVNANYLKKDFHYVFYGEIVDILINE